MLGTIVNTGCIIVGSLVGALFKKGLGEKYSTTLFNAMGLASLALGANSFVQNMPKSEFPVLFILSLAIGGIVGTALDLDGRTKRVLAKRGGESFATGLISACLLQYPSMDALARHGIGGASYPIMIASCLVGFSLFSLLYLKEKLTRLQYAALGCCIAGIPLICL